MSSTGQGDGDPLWKRIAGDFDIRRPMFDGQLVAMNALRNQVAHHARLWMRPTTQTPKLPRKLAKDVRQMNPHPKSADVSCVALAEFLLPSGTGIGFLEDIDQLINSNDNYRVGFCRPITS